MLETLLLLKELADKPLYKNSDEKEQESSEEPDTTDMSELEGEESAAERRKQETRWLSSITLVQLKPGNNSQKLVNKIRQLLYSLYCSKKLTKTIYNHLINTIQNGNHLYEHRK